MWINIKKTLFICVMSLFDQNNLSKVKTTNVDGRDIENVVLKLDGHGEIFLLMFEAPERVNKLTIAILFDNSVKLLWLDGVNIDVLLLVNNCASYMAKAAKWLQILYTSMEYATSCPCLTQSIRIGVIKLPWCGQINFLWQEICISSAMEAEIQGMSTFTAPPPSAWSYTVRFLA